MKLVIPGIPPSANHYKGYNRATGRWYVRKAAIGFKDTVAIIAAGRQMPDAKKYKVEIIVYLPKGKRGDAANFEKVTCDALQAARVIKNDSRARRVEIETRRDWSNPRTEITISLLD